MKPGDLITAHFKLTETQKSALQRLGISLVRDLLYHFPSRYEHGGNSVRTEALIPGAKVTMIGTVSKLKAKKLWKSKRTATTGIFRDASGAVPLM